MRYIVSVTGKSVSLAIVRQKGVKATTYRVSREAFDFTVGALGALVAVPACFLTGFYGAAALAAVVL